MKAGWEIKKLGEVCEIKPPKSEAKKRLQGSEMVSFAPMETLGIGRKYLETNHERRLDEVSGSYTYFAEGDVLLAKITPCFENGKLGIARNLKNGIGFGSSEYIVLRPNRSIYPEWLYHLLDQESFRTEGTAHMSGAVGHKRVSKEFIETFPIPIPPLSEQAHIVGILDEAFASIATAKANTQKNLENAKAVFESHLNSVFSNRGEGWVEKKLGEVCEIKGGGTPSKSVNDYWTGDIPWVSPKDMKSEIVFDSIDHISELAVTESATNLIPEGSVLMVVRSGILARIVPIAITGRKLTINQDIKALCPSNILVSRYLYYLLQGKMESLLGLVSRGATVHRIVTDQIREIPFYLPPLSTQNEIVSQIDSLSEETSRLTSLYTQKLSALEDLKKSLLHQAFTGRL